MPASTETQRIQSYQDLLVWQKAVDLVVSIYALTALFPAKEMFVMTAQMKRSAISIPSNIAEGSRRGTKKDFRHFLLNAFGSGAELETQIIIVNRLSFGKDLDYNKVDQLLNEVMKMLNTLIQNLHE
ncbi:MAG: four helix bundle protein [Patescibacteria group bacterium]